MLMFIPFHAAAPGARTLQHPYFQKSLQVCRNPCRVAVRAASERNGDHEQEQESAMNSPNRGQELSFLGKKDGVDLGALNALRQASGKSRFEAFYNSSDEVVDVEGTVVPTEQGASEATNPFFVGYEADELKALLDVHASLYGLEQKPLPAPAGEAEQEDSDPMGGFRELHAKVMRALEDE